MSTEKELQQVLNLILEKALEATNADAASIYLTENIRIDSIGNSGKKYHTVLRFHRSANRSTGQKIQNRVLDLDYSSIAGFVASTGRAANVPDCYNIPPSEPYHFNPEVDKELGYRTTSMLTVPMVSASGKVRGVLQMINKLESSINNTQGHEKVKTEDIVPFTPDDLELMKAFASQAFVALENAKLTEDIENLFESFIRASVTAIEARDPATSGHSDRVAVLTVEFARAVHQAPSGPFKTLIFSEQQIRELRYAALLHDFGKIGVRESVLTKQKKLHQHEMDVIIARLDSARCKHEMMAWKEMAAEMIEMIEKQRTAGLPLKLARLERKIDDFSQQVNKLRLSIFQANEPQILKSDFDIQSLLEWIDKASRDIGQAILTPEEQVKLALPRGSLGAEERREIESHVTHTYHFLRQIAWTEDLAEVADIAHAHHEKCDGSGYPRGIKSPHIPVQSRMMAIADIYDALTSMDRPYKRALSPERTLEILFMEARQGQLDFDLLKIFIEAEVFRTVDGMLRTRRVA